MIFSKSFLSLISADTSRTWKHSNHPSLLSEENGHLLRHLGSSWASTCHATKMQSSLLDGHQSAWCALKATERSLRSSKQVWQVYFILLLNVWILGSQTGHKSILSLAVYLIWEDKQPACIPHWTSRGKTQRSDNEGRLYVKLQRLQFLVAKPIRLTKQRFQKLKVQPAEPKDRTCAKQCWRCLGGDWSSSNLSTLPSSPG